MTRILLIGVGGGLGSIARYWIGGLVQSLAPAIPIPAGTLAVNVLGCLAIGALAAVAHARGFIGPNAQALLVVGFLAGFTTFSTFANETVSAFRSGSVALALINIVANVVACLVAVEAGRALVQVAWR